jgi:septal ring factor EnvC (AmiA/AmiB activator)
LTQCRAYQQTLRQEERLEQQLQQQQERQNQLDQQQREVQQQLESMRLQNESLRKQLETSSEAPRPEATDYSRSAESRSTELRNAELRSWRADNLWYGTDYARTQFATRYIQQLQQERPDLSGRELLDALSTKVHETFGATH